MTRKTIATFTYRNGRFGENTASLTRVVSDSRWLPNGYSVSNGFGDPFFYTNAVRAKQAFRDMRREYAQ